MFYQASPSLSKQKHLLSQVLKNMSWVHALHPPLSNTKPASSHPPPASYLYHSHAQCTMHSLSLLSHTHLLPCCHTKQTLACSPPPPGPLSKVACAELYSEEVLTGKKSSIKCKGTGLFYFVA